MTLADLNLADRDRFVAALGWVFEDAPWVAERAWARRPFDTLDEVHSAMTSAVASASVEEQLALLRAHPDLGALRVKPVTTGGGARLPPSRKASADRRSLGEGGQADPTMSPASHREQTDAGLSALSSDQLQRLRALNAAYREKFGFPFLYAIKGSTTQDIVDALERRLPSTREAEQQEALRQVYRIARFRLEEVIS